MSFNIIFNILRIISGLPIIFNGESKSRIDLIISTLRLLSGESDNAKLLQRLERDERFRAKAREKVAKLYLRRDELRAMDVINARARDLQLRAGGNRNLKGEMIAWGGVIGLAVVISFMFFNRECLGSDLIIICSSLVELFSKIVFDLSCFEFGGSLGIQ